MASVVTNVSVECGLGRKSRAFYSFDMAKNLNLGGPWLLSQSDTIAGTDGGIQDFELVSTSSRGYTVALRIMKAPWQ